MNSYSFLLLDFADTIASNEFAHWARHPNFPQAFTRTRKLPLPALIGALLSMRSSSQQSLLDDFFGTLCGDGVPHRGVSDRAFAKARQRLHCPALAWLNDSVISLADAAGWVPRWHGFRQVAADASVLMPAVRTCGRTRSLASPDQRLLALYLPGPELVLHASVHACSVAERAMLAEALDHLGADDLLLLDRCYPAAWLIHILEQRGIRYVMRCDSAGGWCAVRSFQRGKQAEAQATLNTPSAQDVADWGCPAHAPSTRLVRSVASTGAVRVLATNVPASELPAHLFGELYDQCWHIEEALKGLKHRLKLELVSGLSEQALIIDVAAKVLTDSLSALLCIAALAAAPIPAARGCNRARVDGIVRALLPKVLLHVGDVLTTICDTMHMVGLARQRLRPERSSPRPPAHVKPHARLAYKG